MNAAVAKLHRVKNERIQGEWWGNVRERPGREDEEVGACGAKRGRRTMGIEV